MCTASRPFGVCHTRFTKGDAQAKPSCCCKKRAAAATASRSTAAMRAAAAPLVVGSGGCTRLAKLLKPGGANDKPIMARSRSWVSAAGVLAQAGWRESRRRAGGLWSRQGGLQQGAARWLDCWRAADAAVCGLRAGGLRSCFGGVMAPHGCAAGRL